jgi:hypothetical protein
VRLVSIDTLERKRGGWQPGLVSMPPRTAAVFRLVGSGGNSLFLNTEGLLNPNHKKAELLLDSIERKELRFPHLMVKSQQDKRAM